MSHEKHAPSEHLYDTAHAPGEAHGTVGQYIAVFVALCVLTLLSFVTMHFFHDTPTIGWTIMMAVSCAKALLVISFFMHLIWEANWKWVLTIPAGMMSIFLVCMLIPDVGRRMRTYSNERWTFSAEPTPASGPGTDELGATPAPAKPSGAKH